MPKNFEYVFAAYGIWVVAFGVYFIHLLRRSRQLSRSLAALRSGKSSQPSGS